MRSRAHLLILFTVAVLLTACSSTEDAFSMKPVPILVAEVTVEDVATSLESIGKLSASTYVEIRPQVSGALLETCVQSGAVVQKDEILYKIDPQPYLLVLHQAKAQLALDKAKLESTKKKLSRYESLTNRDLISQQDWDELRAQVAAAEAVAEQGQARLQNARRDVRHCMVRAPISGRMGGNAVDAGNWVSPGQSTPLTTISALDPISVAFTLTEKEFNQLVSKSHLQHIPLQICSLCPAQLKADGKVTFIDHQFNAQTGLLHLSGAVSNPRKTCQSLEGAPIPCPSLLGGIADPSWLFFPGQGVKVQIPLEVLSQVLVLPARAVRINQTGPYVFIVKADNTVEQRQVTIGSEHDTKVVVAQGVHKGERVVLEGHARLFPGAVVEVKDQ